MAPRGDYAGPGGPGAGLGSSGAAEGTSPDGTSPGAAGAVSVATGSTESSVATAADDSAGGAGDSPVAEVLKVVSANRWPIPMNIEYEYKGGDSVDEVGKCLAYCRRVLNL